MKKLLTFFLAALLTFSVSWAATVTKTINDIITENGFTVSSSTVTCYTSFSLDDNITVSTSGSPNCGAFFGSTTHDWRLYQAKNGDVTITAGNNCTLESITFTYSTSNGGTLQGAASGTAVSVSGTSATYIVSNTGSATNGQVKITAISVTYSGGANFVDPPTITPSGGIFATSQTVSMTHADADAIYFTLDGSDPTSSSTLYTGEFTLTTTTTVKAIAVKDGVSSSPATATFTNVGVGTIAEAYAFTQNSQFIFTGNAVVTYQNGRFVWIRDNSGSGLIYRVSSETGSFNNGDILDAGWTGTNSTYNSIREFNNASGVTSSSNGGTVAPFDRTSTGITTANVNEYVSLSNVRLSWDTSLGYCYVTINNNKVYFRDYFSLGLTVTSNHTYNIEGIVYIQNGNAFVYMTSATEVTTSEPLLETSTDVLTFNDSGTGNTITVTGSNLGGDNVGLTLATENSKFTPTLTATTGSATDGGTYWYFTPSGGSLNGTVAMSYTGRELSASETVTLANNVASTTVTVNYRSDVYILGNYGSGWDYSNGILMTYDDTNNTYTATVTAEVGDLIVFARKLGESNPWNTRILFGPSSDGDWWVNTTPNPKTGTIDLNDDDPIYFNSAGTYTIEINATTGALTLTKEAENTGDFSLVTNINDLNAGDEIIFVSTGTAGSAYAMSTSQANNRPGTAVTVSNGLKVTATDATQILTLEGSSSGWYFHTVNGDNQGYIYAASSSSNYLKTEATADDNAKATISLASDGAATIIFQGNYTRNYMRYNPNNNSPIFSCYGSTSTVGNLAYIYKRTASNEPSITVNPSSLNLVIPAGGSSQSGIVTVTEENTTGTTSVSIDGDTNIFSATLDNGTLTVTYSGTATSSDPDVATVTITDGSASAIVNVTGYKEPLTVTITPSDGHTFQGSTVTGIIESNVADATIEYSFDGTAWNTYDADNGFTTPEVATEGGTVTVYARATYNGETATAQVTYTHEAPSKKCTADIVFDPTSNDGGVTLWSTLQQHMSDGVDYISDATMAAVFTSKDYAAMRFGSGKNVGTMMFTLNLKNFDGGACKLTKVTINAARYSNDTECSLNVSTNVSSNGQTVSITAAQDDFADYVFNFDGSEITTLTIANLEAGKRVYVHSIILEYNCPEAAELSVIEREFETSTQEKVAVTDRLIGVWAAKDILWAKDQGNASIDATSIREGEQVDYVRKAKLKSVDAPFQIDEWDQSNWVMLDFSGIDAEPADYVGYELETNSIVGHYVDDMNYCIELLKAPTTVGNQMEDYPGFDGDPIDEANRYNLNHYVSSNFYEPNLNWGGNTGYWYEGTFNGQSLDTCIFFMNPKICEIAQVWAVWNAELHQFTIYEREGFNVNGYDLDGAFTMTQETWKYNCRSTASGLRDDELYGSVEDDLEDNAYYMFHVAVMRNNFNYGHHKEGSQPSGKRNAVAKDSTATSDSIRVYPLDLTNEGAQNPPTGIHELLKDTGKTVESVRYFNVMGMESKTPFEGINIVVTRYTDGSFSTAKVLK